MTIIKSIQLRLDSILEKFKKDLENSTTYPDIRIRPFRGMFTDKQRQAVINKSSFDVTRCYMKWTNREDNQLTLAFQMGKNPQQLAVSHKRTLGAIYCRLIKLNLITRSEVLD